MHILPTVERVLFVCVVMASSSGNFRLTQYTILLLQCVRRQVWVDELPVMQLATLQFNPCLGKHLITNNLSSSKENGNAEDVMYTLRHYQFSNSNARNNFPLVQAMMSCVRANSMPHNTLSEEDMAVITDKALSL